MNLGDVAAKTGAEDDAWSARRARRRRSRPAPSSRIACHASIGVLGAVSVATACLLPGAPAAALAHIPDGRRKTLPIEHPSGEMTVVADLAADGTVERTAILRTARKLFDGIVFAR